MRVDLEDGFWVEITPIQNLKNKHRAAYDGALRIMVPLDDEGRPNIREIPFGLSMQAIREYALFSMILLDWNVKDDDGAILPLPKWDRSAEKVQNLESIEEIPLDMANKIWDEILPPYVTKVERKADPKKTTTGASSATSKQAKVPSPKG